MIWRQDNAAAAVIGSYDRLYGGDARRIQHFIKVHALAQLIGRQEQLNERTQFILEAAALTHDIGIKNGEAKFGAGKCSGKRRSWRDRRQRQNCWQS